MKEGTAVDATISAPSSTKNKSGKRDPNMSSTPKNGQWHFGMKAHEEIKKGYTMSKSTIVEFGKPDTVADELTDLLRLGASRLILEAVEAELADFLSAFTNDWDKQVRLW